MAAEILKYIKLYLLISVLSFYYFQIDSDKWATLNQPRTWQQPFTLWRDTCICDTDNIHRRKLVWYKMQGRVKSPWQIHAYSLCPCVAHNSSNDISNSVTWLSAMYSTSPYQHTAGLTMTEWISECVCAYVCARVRSFVLKWESYTETEW